MSLDVALYIKNNEYRIPTKQEGTGIWIREDGRNKEISWEEWREKFGEATPCILANTEKDVEDEVCIYEANITHNLVRMAEYVELYEVLWRPEELFGYDAKAEELIPYLQRGIDLLIKTRDKCKTLYSPSNGWGTYEGLLTFTTNYLEACRQYPKARVWVSR